jgi:hypothetical protein
LWKILFSPQKKFKSPEYIWKSEKRQGVTRVTICASHVGVEKLLVLLGKMMYQGPVNFSKAIFQNKTKFLLKIEINQNFWKVISISILSCDVKWLAFNCTNHVIVRLMKSSPVSPERFSPPRDFDLCYTLDHHICWLFVLFVLIFGYFWFSLSTFRVYVCCKFHT